VHLATNYMKIFYKNNCFSIFIRKKMMGSHSSFYKFYNSISIESTYQVVCRKVFPSLFSSELGSNWTKDRYCHYTQITAFPMEYRETPASGGN
jgi:hypothetical protein